MGRLGIVEIAVIVGALVLLFGAKKFPELTKSIAEGLKVFKKEMKSEDSEVKSKK